MLQLQNNLATKSDWAWWKGSPKVLVIQDIFNKLQGKLTETQQEFVFQDLDKVRAKYDAQKVAVELRAFIQVKPTVADLNNKVGAMFAAATTLEKIAPGVES